MRERKKCGPLHCVCEGKININQTKCFLHSRPIHATLFRHWFFAEKTLPWPLNTVTWGSFRGPLSVHKDTKYGTICPYKRCLHFSFIFTLSISWRFEMLIGTFCHWREKTQQKKKHIIGTFFEVKVNFINLFWV